MIDTINRAMQLTLRAREERERAERVLAKARAEELSCARELQRLIDSGVIDQLGEHPAKAATQR